MPGTRSDVRTAQTASAFLQPDKHNTRHPEKPLSRRRASAAFFPASRARASAAFFSASRARTSAAFLSCVPGAQPPIAATLPAFSASRACCFSASSPRSSTSLSSRCLSVNPFLDLFSRFFLCALSSLSLCHFFLLVQGGVSLCFLLALFLSSLCPFFLLEFFKELFLSSLCHFSLLLHATRKKTSQLRPEAQCAVAWRLRGSRPRCAAAPPRTSACVIMQIVRQRVSHMYTHRRTRTRTHAKQHKHGESPLGLNPKPQMMMSFICCCRNKIGPEPSSIYALRKVSTIGGCLEGLKQHKHGESPSVEGLNPRPHECLNPAIQARRVPLRPKP